MQKSFPTTRIYSQNKPKITNIKKPKSLPSTKFPPFFLRMFAPHLIEFMQIAWGRARSLRAYELPQANFPFLCAKGIIMQDLTFGTRIERK
jgi:hypothetical protein